MPPIDDEVRYYLLKLLETSPQLSQRQLAKTMGVSLGKANYCLRAFIERGWVKAKNFQSQKKHAYSFFLTPKGVNERARATARFLKLKIRQYDNLITQIEQLQREVEQTDLLAGAKMQVASLFAEKK